MAGGGVDQEYRDPRLDVLGKGLVRTGGESCRVGRGDAGLVWGVGPPGKDEYRQRNVRPP